MNLGWKDSPLSSQQLRKDDTIKESKIRLLLTGLVPLFTLAHFSHHILTALLVPLLPLIRNDFALDYTKAGIVVLVFNLSYGIGQLPAGWLADRIGSRILLTISICGVALCGLLVGLSQSYLMMIIFLVMMGVAGGGYHPSAAPLVSASVEPDKRGRALGLHMIGGSGSFFLAPLFAAAMSKAWGWRGTFTWLSIPTMVFGIIFYIIVSRRMSTRKVTQSSTSQKGTVSSPPVHIRHLIAFMVLSIFTQAVTFAVIAFIPLFMVDHFSTTEGTAAAFLSVIYSAGLWASFLGGYLSDRYDALLVTLTVCFATGPFIYLLSFVPYGGGMAIGALLLIIGILMYIRMPVSEAYIISHTPNNYLSTIMGIYYFSSMEAGGLFSPILGNLIDKFGFYASFSAASVAVVVGTIICLFFLRRSKSQSFR